MIKKRLFYCFYFLLTSTIANAWFSPADNSVLNYTQIMFETEEVSNTDYYVFTIKDEKGKQVATYKTQKLTYLCSNKLNFGNKYIWQVVAYVKNKPPISSPNFSFTIATHSKIDTATVRFFIDKKVTGKYDPSLLFIDNLGIAINREGKPIWFLPDRNDLSADKNNFRTLQMTEDGNLTFIYNSICYEVDLSGNVLWQSPNVGTVSGDATEYYHHDFKKMPFGSYLCASYKYFNEPNFYNEKNRSRVRYNTLIEYDTNGNIVWQWTEKDNVPKATIFENENATSTEVAGTHLNGFAFDAVNSFLYTSYRNTSQVIQLAYPSGKPTYIWKGTTVVKDSSKDYSFAQQHGPSITADGNVVIYNNNITNSAKPTYPTVLIMRKPTIDGKSTLLWNYNCTWKKKPKGIQTKEGYAIELPNKNILICIGGTERIVEVNKDKQVVWDCNFDKWDEKTNSYIPFTNYRCTYTKSLYPFYFTVQHSNVKNTFVINNDGSSDDSYAITVLSKDGQMEIAKFATFTVKSYTSLTIALAKYTKSYHDIVIKVKSIQHKSTEKMITLTSN